MAGKLRHFTSLCNSVIVNTWVWNKECSTSTGLFSTSKLTFIGAHFLFSKHLSFTPAQGLGNWLSWDKIQEKRKGRKKKKLTARKAYLYILRNWHVNSEEKQKRLENEH